MRRRSLLLALSLLALAPACKRTPAGGANKVKVQLNWVAEPEFGGLYAARDAGAYQRAGLDVDIVAGGAGVPVIQLVATGKVDFAIAGADDVVIARARGIDVVAVFATFQSSPLGVMVHESRASASSETSRAAPSRSSPGCRSARGSRRSTRSKG